MVAPNSTEAEVLSQCSELIRFAAENKSGLPIDVVTDIESGLQAAQTEGSWNAQVAGQFWCAYDKLCSHLRPVTLDTLSAARPVPSWLRVFGRSRKTTVAKRWAFLFLTVMVLLLGSSLFCAFL